MNRGGGGGVGGGGGGYGLENPARFCFYGTEKAKQWSETRLTKTEEQLKESVNYCLKFNISFLWKNSFVISNIRPDEARCQLEPQKSVRYSVSAT